MSPSVPSFAEIRVLAGALPRFDQAIADAVQAAIIAEHTRKYENEAVVAGLVAGAQRSEQPSVMHPRVALFAAAHGIAADLDLGWPEAIAAEVTALVGQRGDLHRSVEARNADFRLYELALHLPTRDSRVGPAMREDEAARAMAYGMMAVEPGLDVILLASHGLGGDLAASAIRAALSPEAAAEPGFYRNRVAAAVRRHAGTPDPLAVLAAFGGPDIAAMAGAILAARLSGAAVILDGKGAAAAGAIVKRLCGDGLDHCLGAGEPHSLLEAGLAALDFMRLACALVPDR